MDLRLLFLFFILISIGSQSIAGVYCQGHKGNVSIEVSWIKNNLKIQAMGCEECITDPNAEPYYDLTVTKTTEDECGYLCTEDIFETRFAEYGAFGSLFTYGFQTYIEFPFYPDLKRGKLIYFENVFDRKTIDLNCVESKKI